MRYFRSKAKPMSAILGFSGSNSSTSINHRLVKYTLNKLKGDPVELIDLAALKLPMYDIDAENESGIPEVILGLNKKIQSCKGWVFSVNEHNGNPSAYTKSLLDWLSRQDRNFASEIKILLLSTSPGRGGASSSRGIVSGMLKRFGAEDIIDFGLPSFNHNFSDSQGITDAELAEAYDYKCNQFLTSI